MKSLPSNVQVYKRTPDFTEATVPAGLLKFHQTKDGTWGRIQVTAGALLYRILEPTLEEHVLTPGQPGIVEPQVLHEVSPQGAVQFYVEFLQATKK